MLFSVLSIAFAGLMASVSAQSSTSAYPYTVSANDPNASPAARNGWCVTQKQSCNMICGTSSGPLKNNTCDPTTLEVNCVCGDGSMPNLGMYNDTLYYFECQNAYKPACVAAHPTDAVAQSSCNAIMCGGMAPTAMPSSSSASATPSGEAGSTTGTAAVQAGATAAGSSAAATGGAIARPTGGDQYVFISALVVGLMFLGGVAL